ncbi:MAG: hypothetical protein A2252_04265 [Elusimicrobia bacterium RIFOXYA2_FULL_39_19]|nr:MAG: hypothetical protein A2252_04265 [Elusimicrobia bacterium RIFOXYA2_FULL_39_19]
MTINGKNFTNDTLVNYSGSVDVQAISADSETYAGTGVLGITVASLVNGTITKYTQTYTKAERIKLKVVDSNGKTGTSNIIYVGGGTATKIELTANPQSIISGQTSFLTAKLEDYYGNVLKNTEIDFSVVKGSGVINISSGTTNANGEVSALFSYNLSQPGISIVQARTANLSIEIPVRASVLFVPGTRLTITATEDPNTKLTFPADAVTENIEISISLKVDLDTTTVVELIDVANSKLLGKIISELVRKFTANKVSNNLEYGEFEKLVSIEIPYMDSNNDGIVDGTQIEVNNLKAARLNETTKEWETVNDGGINEVDRTKKVVSCDVKHFSYYTIGDFNSATLTPNPKRGLETVKPAELHFGDANAVKKKIKELKEKIDNNK